MHLSLRLLAHQALGLAALTEALTLPIGTRTTTTNPYEGLTPREVTLRSGETVTIWENRALHFTETRSDSSPPTNLDRRLTYTTYTGTGGRNDYCGESDPTVTHPTGGALAADCNALRLAYTDPVTTIGVKGYWTVTAADFTGATGGWVTLAASGTCKFPIQYSGGGSPQTVYFGANDMQFYLGDALQGQTTGTILARGSVSCNNNTAGVLLGVGYQATHV
ncbi:hypothetical protein QBC47DRAFT_460411 [Echria macrotheca]|uniref:Ecp2 effector protein-like domain-containing protein n=1 Tax=Echria macrotheca TaxID=438768 RepID=A0AAJ0BCM5_9PEZI|nr:hypothetical protein QBC47DRAFT_460411 [Echria macrotheca]